VGGGEAGGGEVGGGEVGGGEVDGDEVDGDEVDGASSAAAARLLVCLHRFQQGGLSAIRRVDVARAVKCGYGTAARSCSTAAPHSPADVASLWISSNKPSRLPTRPPPFLWCGFGMKTTWRV